MFVYADNAATTSVSKTALDAMMPYLTENYGNPSSLYAFAQKATEAVAQARATVAACLNAEPREIYFTSGGSEADNQAIIAAAKYRHDTYDFYKSLYVVAYQQNLHFLHV